MPPELRGNERDAERLLNGRRSTFSHCRGHVEGVRSQAECRVEQRRQTDGFEHAAGKHALVENVPTLERPDPLGRLPVGRRNLNGAPIGTRCARRFDEGRFRSRAFAHRRGRLVDQGRVRRRRGRGQESFRTLVELRGRRLGHPIAGAKDERRREREDRVGGYRGEFTGGESLA